SWTCCALLSIVPSEAAVERTFSAQKFAGSPLRNKIGDETVRNELCVRVNYGVFDQTPLPPIECIEELEDEEARDDDDDFLSDSTAAVDQRTPNNIDVAAA